MVHVKGRLMSSGESPPLDPPAGSPVDDEEESYRVIGPELWLRAEERVSSMAFSFPMFSVDIASIAGSPQATLTRFRQGSGLVVLPCRDVRLLGCDVRRELDPADPANLVHAHVYMSPSASKGKAAANMPVERCRALVKPSLPNSE
jgi:hypothetical protein